MSWWVGKDRDAFNVALKEHTTRVMRKAPPVAPPPEPPPVVPTLTPAAPPVADAAPTSEASSRTTMAYHARRVEAGLCRQCGQPRNRYAVHCDACRAKANAATAANPWYPGGPGRPPAHLQSLLTTAKDVEAAILSSDEAAADAALGRAAIVMFVGFLFRQRLDWIVGWTKFQERECQRIAARLRRYRVWHADDGTIACRWLDLVFTQKTKPTKHDRFEFEVAFWLDALVAKGEVTREAKDGDFLYGLVEWERT